MRSLRKIIKNLAKEGIESDKNFLDARYWNEIFRSYPKYGTLYLDVYKSENKIGVELELNTMNLSTNTDLPSILRLRIQTDDYIHNNLVIIDDLEKEIIRYEPFYEDVNIDDSIKQFIYLFLDRNVYRDYKYTEIYGNHNDTQCVARCIMYALEYISQEELNSNIEQCCSIIEHVYGELEGEPVIEYGRRGVLGGALVGGLGGALIGGAIAGPVGAVAGFALGGLAGGAVGSRF